MQIVLTVDGGTPRYFSSEKILIGRRKTNDLVLTERAVSGVHAVITREEAGFVITDLSTNGTMLNGGKLEKNNPRTLMESDAIRIIEHEIVIGFKDDSVIPETNPLAESVDQLGNALLSVRSEFDGVERGKASQYLQEAWSDVSKKRNLNGAIDEICNELFELPSASGLKPPTEDISAREHDYQEKIELLERQKVELEQELKDAEAKIERIEDENRKLKDKIENFIDPQKMPVRLNQVLSKALETFLNLELGRINFESEFFGTTFTSKGIPLSSLSAMNGHLFDPQADKEVVAERLAQFEALVAGILRHQLGLLRGYRIAVREGVVEIVEQLCPDNIANEKNLGSAALKRLLGDPKLIQTIRDRCKEFADDKALIDNIFLKHFRRGYFTNEKNDSN